jgi:Xaa-Pro aminopeptidase
MKQDLDFLMAEAGLDALVVTGKMLGNAALYYMVNGAKVGGGTVVQKRGGAPVFLCSPIEREEAAASGLDVVNTVKYDYTGILRERGDPLAATVEYYRRIFADLGVSGKVGFYGLADPGSAWMLLSALDGQLEGLQVRGEFSKTLLEVARATKDPAEVERIRAVGRRTETVVGQTVEFLQSHRAHDGALVQKDGTPLTLGRVRREIGRFLAEQALEPAEGMIFSIGRDAGIPHNQGNPDDLMRLGQTIVFDLYPREIGGGYFFDITRTFCLGHAPAEVEKVYRDVYDCQAAAVAWYRVGAELRLAQRMACQFFEGQGHPTIGSDPKTESGYVHGLSHGIGLAIHEEPFSSDTPNNTVSLRPGHVFSCEPGLYYPDQGFGVRIEDVIAIDPDGVVHNLTAFPKELVIPVK